MMKIFTPFTVILLVLSTNALPYQSNKGTGRFDQDFVGIDSSIDGIGIESPIDRIGPKGFMPIPIGMHITRDEEAKDTADNFHVYLRWEKYPNFCVSDSNQDLQQSKHSKGGDNVEKCQKECISNKKCSAIEWYEAGLNGVRCYLIIDDIPATKGSTTSRWRDATCYIKPDKCKWFGTATLCNGECPKGSKEMMRSESGDGKKCRTGSKAYCCEYLWYCSRLAGGKWNEMKCRKKNIDELLLGGLPIQL